MAKTQEMNAVVIAVEEIKNLVDARQAAAFVGKTFLPITMPRDLIESPAAAVHAWRFGPTHLHSR